MGRICLDTTHSDIGFFFLSDSKVTSNYYCIILLKGRKLEDVKMLIFKKVLTNLGVTPPKGQILVRTICNSIAEGTFRQGEGER